MKTLDEIISRHDYVRVNKSLVKRVRELAPIFAKKFYELTDYTWRNKTEFPEYAVNVNGHFYCAIARRITGNKIEEMSFVRVFHSTYTDGLEHFFIYHDLEYCTNYSVCLDFLNDATDILANLDEKESELVKDAEQAIENSSHIQTN